MAFDLNDTLGRMLMEEPIWGTLSRGMNKREMSSIPTAGVCITPDGCFELVYNPSFFEILQGDYNNPEHNHSFTVLRHEFLHCVLNHLTTRKDLGGDKYNMLQNVAFDLAINSHLPSFTSFDYAYKQTEKGWEWVRCVNGKAPAGYVKFEACMPTVGMYSKFPKGLTAEKYYEMLKDDEKKGKKQKSEGNPSQGKGDPSESLGKGVLDDHGWEEPSPEALEIAKERLKAALEQGVNEANKTGRWGTVPSEIKDRIIKFVNGTVDWRKILRYFIQSSIKADRKNSIKQINRRFPYIHAGKRSDRTANIAISIDQSGSVSDEMLSKFFGELNNLADICTFTVIPFDCSVDENLIEVWKKGQKQTAKRVKTGGTDFNAPTKYVNDAKIFDAHIILTDMQAPKPVPSRIPRMWMTTEDMMKHVPFSTTERIIAVH